MSKVRIQHYMEKHKLTPLFEELMGKVLHDQPDDPLVYLIKCLYRKAALPVPKDLKPGTLRRSSPERIGRRSKSPEKSAAQAWAVASGPELVDRSYEKPWLTQTRKSRGKEDEKTEGVPKQGRKQKAGWVGDTKITTTTFDDLFEDDHTRQDQAVAKQKKEKPTNIKTAWARNVGLEDSEDVNFRSKGYSGPRSHRNDEDPLSGEIMLATEESSEQSSVSTTKSRSAKLEAQKHRKDLERILNESDKVSVDSGFDGDRMEGDVEDDAIELLEDPDDLQREGVTNISKSGYKLSRVLKQRQEEANVKLNIKPYGTDKRTKICSFVTSVDPDLFDGNQYDDYYESDLERPQTGMSYQSNRFSEYSPEVSEDDEFESVSQVVGPRKPVWNVPDSEGETFRPDPMSRTLPPSGSRPKQAQFSATVPARFDDTPFRGRSVDSENVFLQKTDSRDLERPVESPVNVRDSVRTSRSRDAGGWTIPDDTEVSMATEWSEAKSSGRPAKGPPKAY